MFPDFKLSHVYGFTRLTSLLTLQSFDSSVDNLSTKVTDHIGQVPLGSSFDLIY